MELLNILSVLARHRLLLGLGVLVSCLAGLLALYQVSSVFPPHLVSRAHPYGDASVRVAVDAPDGVPEERYADVEYTLGIRALLLSDLLAGDASRGVIARTAGLPADSLVVNGPAVGIPPATTQLSGRIAASEKAPAAPYVVTVRSDGQVPLIAIDVVAPNADDADRVASAAADQLKRLAAPADSTTTHNVTVEQLGEVVAEQRLDAPSRALAFAVAVVLMGSWCVALVVFSDLARARRVRRAHTGSPRTAL